MEADSQEPVPKRQSTSQPRCDSRLASSCWSLGHCYKQACLPKKQHHPMATTVRRLGNPEHLFQGINVWQQMPEAVSVDAYQEVCLAYHSYRMDTSFSVLCVESWKAIDGPGACACCWQPCQLPNTAFSFSYLTGERFGISKDAAKIHLQSEYAGVSIESL